VTVPDVVQNAFVDAPLTRTLQHQLVGQHSDIQFEGKFGDVDCSSVGAQGPFSICARSELF
jgi:hypothetical protein